ncbi:DeoR/GlpR family transcriptional regulator of sugar metabolism [Catenulispora sp. GAS73]|uniref:DeoR/GlpR family DNA-binding transcription regulator n=1 Tax=Catenulispora sp. GAS73 TaxID=3156269 RepID=UPI0035197A95
MLAAQRQARILEEVQRTGGVRVNDLTRLLGVSDMTVRRDLDVLDSRGLLTKVHGGATVRRAGSTDEPAFTVKAEMEQPAKDAIARKAAELVRPGTAIGISGGSTTYTLARHLVGVPDLTVVTNSLRVADVLHAHESANPGNNQTVILTGGMRTPSEALVGPIAVQAIRTLHLDQVFLGVYGMDAAAGYTSPNLMESETNRALVSAARNLVVVADHTKWGVVGLSAFAGLGDAAVLVTDDGLPREAREVLVEEVGELVLAERDE